MILPELRLKPERCFGVFDSGECNDRGDRDPVKLFRRCGSDEAVFLPSEDILKQAPDINTLD
ncbi:hypothetical protein [Bradyrhizobium sp. URHD0069]|uniref:hypothetical protein n=1 Tax=Bradyrhizobium sp. URHD0069 TaxID=1380355 RepID=UPI0004966970|nr:hypothetical protein [Bradyrhizobium sp. URHD0069]